MAAASAQVDAMTVLVVEDEEMLLSIIQAEFEEAGFGVAACATGEEAVAFLAGAGRVDLLFTDIQLPGALDGWGVAEQARSLAPDLPVIYATGFSVGPPRQVPGSILLRKPYRLAKLVETALGLIGA
jgi:CheY-like chemotaxis protein